MNCPTCRRETRKVPRLTLERLLTVSARTRLVEQDGFRFCPDSACDVVYIHPSGSHFTKGDLAVPVFQKDSDPYRLVCYCFEHSVREVEQDAAPDGSSAIADSITQQCRKHLDRCEETNPQGTCCLGNVRGVAKGVVGVGAPAVNMPHREDQTSQGDIAMDNSEESRTTLATSATLVGAVMAAVAASACCVGPLIVAMLGLGGAGALMALTPYRPLFLTVTAVLLGIGFYMIYGRRPALNTSGNDSMEGDACGCDEAAPRRTRGVAKALLWVATAVVTLAALSPNIISAVVGDGDDFDDEFSEEAINTAGYESGEPTITTAPQETSP